MAAILQVGQNLAIVALHPRVDDVVRTYLDEIDAHAPGLLEGLYLTGSVAMGDFQPGRALSRRGPSGASASDIDFVAVTSRPLTKLDVTAANRAHAQLARNRWRASFDGLYLTWSDLPRDPADVACSAHTHGDQVRTGGQFQANPVVWHELAQHGLAMRGPRPETLRIWTDRDTLTAWSRTNLSTYWRRWQQRSSAPMSRAGLACLTSWGPTWGVLGVSRLHYTVSTGLIWSKTDGGRYAREAFDPHWHRLIDECLRIRRSLPGRSAYRTPLTRRRDALNFIDMVISDVGSP
ncbi:MAG: DNA polymerase subunit beta [Pseudonocardiales bacterium]|nr:DUF4111 domain-containing protein [Actinomycetota bacterium]PZS21255.1 MAG: DNA polymerase subunit beta [Pseudonocardiales bacterium]